MERKLATGRSIGLFGSTTSTKQREVKSVLTSEGMLSGQNLPD